MPETLPRSYDYSEEAYRESGLSSEKGNERRASYALLPRKVVLSMDENGGVHFNFHYPVTEDGGREEYLSRSEGRIQRGKYTQKVLWAYLPPRDEQDLSDRLHTLAKEIRRESLQLPLPAVQSNYAIVSRFIDRNRDAIICDIKNSEQWR